MSHQNSYIIRVYAQDLDSKKITPNQMFEDFRLNGLKIIKSAGSSFVACFFLEVTGDYTGLIDIDKTEINPKTFNWIV